VIYLVAFKIEKTTWFFDYKDLNEFDPPQDENATEPVLGTFCGSGTNLRQDSTANTAMLIFRSFIG
jgi:hypothetical protein